MVRIIAVTLCLLTLCFSMFGCSNDPTPELRAEIYNLEMEIADLKEQKAQLSQEIVDTKVENGTAKYVLTLSIKQIHYSFDLDKHLKDMLNEINIVISVDKDYYNSVQVGDIVSEEFRVGSAVVSGSYGSWKVTVKDKTII